MSMDGIALDNANTFPPGRPCALPAAGLFASRRLARRQATLTCT